MWSGDAARARELAGRMQSGTVWVNQHLNFGPEAPLAGAKQSGLGVEWTALGLAEFCQINVINQAA
ncbi:aldehyde dehydrogenase family protein [Xanthomonas theicola]|uniref:aldehyde dehydrogenase family protein n=1 Tax=Xanthomonas theicola TaxID=56464 RepID=UPI001B7FFEB1|nr:aldehyde dehydrogenase family protein [Xanthomonas theicola]